MTAPDELHTDRLRLRRVVADDLVAALAIMGDPETNRYNPDGVPAPSVTAGHLVEWQRQWETDGIGYWAVELRGEVIGFGGLRTHDLDGEATLNLFYRFAPAHWGRGYAPEEARRMGRCSCTAAGRRVEGRASLGHRESNVQAPRVQHSRTPVSASGCPNAEFKVPE